MVADADPCFVAKVEVRWIKKSVIVITQEVIVLIKNNIGIVM